MRKPSLFPYPKPIGRYFKVKGLQFFSTKSGARGLPPANQPEQPAAKAQSMKPKPQFTICPAHKDEAGDLANLVVMAGDGLPLHTWEAMLEDGETAMDVGRRRAARTEGAFSYMNADVAIRHGRVLSAIVSYPMTSDSVPAPSDDVPPVFQPLVDLENQVIGSWYVNILASYPEARRQGAASALLCEVESRAVAAGYETLSLIVSDTNPARKLYENHGFGEVSRAKKINGPLKIAGQDWILMVKNIG